MQGFLPAEGLGVSPKLRAISYQLMAHGEWGLAGSEAMPWVTARLADQVGELTRTTCNEIDSICVAMLESG